MKIGRCFHDFESGVDGYRRLKELGYEYLEIPLAAAAACDEEKLSRVRLNAEAGGLGIEACNIFFPGTLALLGARFDEKAVYGYAADALRKAALLGIRMAVLGSGGARRRPDDMPAAEAAEKLAAVFAKTAGIAAENGVTIALEPLNTAECNIITSGAEGIAMVERVNRENFKLLLDIYHMDQNHEPLDAVQKAAPMLRHCHLAAVPNRAFPGPGRADSYSGFLEALKNAGYRGNMSVESSFETEAADGGVWHLRRWAEENMK